MNEVNGQTVRDVGEFGLIARLRAALPPETVAGPDLALGIGDDAAVWRPTPGERLVVTTDGLVEGIHFRLDWTDWASLGHKALAVNLSDLAAMGAVPRLAVVSLGLRGDEEIADLVDFYRGLGALAARTGTLIAGGDVVASPAALTLHVTAIGESRGGRVLSRAGARPGDVVAVSGTLGASAAGLRLLAEGAEGPRRGTTTAATLIDAHLRPTPRLDLAPLLLAHGATAAMDLSDGLLGDLPKILSASDVAARLDAKAIPVAAAVRALFPDDWLALATKGGEDYELLFTAPPRAFTEIREVAVTVGATVAAVGGVVAAVADSPSLTMRHGDGLEEAVASGAFDHFRGER